VIYPRLVYFQGLHRQQSIKSVPLPSCARFHQVQENPDGKGSEMRTYSFIPTRCNIRQAAVSGETGLSALPDLGLSRHAALRRLNTDVNVRCNDDASYATGD